MPISDSFRVEIVPAAQDDIRRIIQHIAFELHAPEAALNFENNLRNKISKLSFMPDSIRPINEEPWHSIGIRKIQVNNYYVYYFTDRPSLTVSVIAVIYTRRDQKKQIEQRGMDAFTND